MRQKGLVGIIVTAAIVLSLSVLSSFVIAHGGVDDGHPEGREGSGERNGRTLDDTIRHNTALAVGGGGALLFLLVLAAAAVKGKGKNKKPKGFVLHLLFWSMAVIIVAVTAYVAGSTIYLNVVSETGGPVHWHADFEVWKCGELVDLVDPKGLSNKIGSPVLHEHGDSRMHVEGVIVDYRDASLGKFLAVVGGDLKRGWLRVPTATGKGEVTMKDGDKCGSDGAGNLQIFVWKTVGEKAVQEKLTGHYDDYVLSPHSQVPPGDCIILEFDTVVKEKTERLCESYRVALKLGKITAGAGLHGG